MGEVLIGKKGKKPVKGKLATGITSIQILRFSLYILFTKIHIQKQN